MYSSFYLSNKQVKSIQEFHEGIYPLILFGPVGCGKTTMAREILKMTQMSVIDASMIRDHPEITRITENLSKRNITQMFLDSRTMRGLLIDDIHIFHKDDRKTYALLTDLLETGRTGDLRNTQIVVTCLPSMMNHRKFSALDTIKVSLDKSPEMSSWVISIPSDSLLTLWRSD